MSDDADRASQQNDMILPLLIAKARDSERGDSLGFCLVCGDEIPARRMEVQPGCVRCVGCQELRGRR